MLWAPSTYDADARQLNEPCQFSPKLGERYVRFAMPPLFAQPLAHCSVMRTRSAAGLPGIRTPPHLLP